ncbi:hypothetical protein Tco_1325639, partial [Tanacetum coccineum]
FNLCSDEKCWISSDNDPVNWLFEASNNSNVADVHPDKLFRKSESFSSNLLRERERSEWFRRKCVRKGKGCQFGQGTNESGNDSSEIKDYEWYEALEDSELKDEALRNKTIMEGFINEDDDESRYEQKRQWNIYTNYDDAYEINHEDNEREELCEVHELPV